MKSKNLKEFSNSHFLKFMKLRSIDILLVYCSTACVTVCSVSPGIVGAIGCGIAVLSDAFGCTSAPFAARKDGRMFSRMVSWEEKSGATLLPLRRYCVII